MFKHKGSGMTLSPCTAALQSVSHSTLLNLKLLLGPQTFQVKSVTVFTFTGHRVQTSVPCIWLCLKLLVHTFFFFWVYHVYVLIICIL